MSSLPNRGQPQNDTTRGVRCPDSRGNPRSNPRPTQPAANAPASEPFPEANHIERLANLRVVDPDTDEERTVGRDSSEDEVYVGGGEVFAPTTGCRLPTLYSPTGPPIIFSGLIGGAFAVPPNEDPSTFAVSMGFPVSVHPLRIPNTRADHSSASTHSVIDFRFVRLAGLLHTMVPLRRGVDDVELKDVAGGTVDVKGYVDIIFDALGYEFEQRCWVIDLGCPLELQLGDDWAHHNQISLKFSRFASAVFEADAKRVRSLDDTYVIR